MKQGFDRVDTDGDGFIDAKEAAALSRRIQQMKQDGGGSPGAGGS